MSPPLLLSDVSSAAAVECLLRCCCRTSPPDSNVRGVVEVGGRAVPHPGSRLVEAGGYSSSGRTGIVVLAAKVESGGYSSSGRTGIVVLAAKVESGGYSSSGRTGIVVPPFFLLGYSYWDLFRTFSLPQEARCWGFLSLNSTLR